VIALLWFMLAGCDSAGAAGVEQQWLAHEWEPARLEHILAPDFVHALGSGQFITKAQHIGYVATHPARPGFHARFEQLDVRLVSGVAIATGIVASHDSASAQIDRRFVFTDVFACRDGRWQAVGAQETPIASTSR
jgi:uncharacterized protein DUF4440